jgi:serine protease Do
MKKKIGVSKFFFLVGSIINILMSVSCQGTTEHKTPVTPQAVKTENINNPTSPPPALGIDFVPLVQQVRPAVVKVTSEAIIERRFSTGDDFFDRFFNIPQRKEKEHVSGLGSGFFISTDGYILTNNHVVKDAVKITVTDINNNNYKAKKIGTDPKTDLALIKIDGDNHPFLVLGDSDSVQVGEWVLAIGNPLGQDLSVTSGIVSAKGRELPGLHVDYQSFIQTDAAINQGNSGGPLVRTDGTAIGINSVILSTSGGNIGIGFSIPSNMAKKVINDLKAKGRVVRGYLGVQITQINDEEAKQLDLPQGGVLVASIEPDTPAQKAGLKKYDLIIEVNGKPINSVTELRTTIASLNPGDTIQLTLYREKTRKTVEVKIVEAPGSISVKKGEGKEGQLIELGMVLKDNSRTLAERYNLSTTEGIIVIEVERGGAASQNGLQPGDVIIGVNRTQIENVEQFEKIMSGKSGSTVFISVIRGEQEYLARFRVPDKK